jgi:hypothetical protein
MSCKGRKHDGGQKPTGGPGGNAGGNEMAGEGRAYAVRQGAAQIRVELALISPPRSRLSSRALAVGPARISKSRLSLAVERYYILIGLGFLPGEGWHPAWRSQIHKLGREGGVAKRRGLRWYLSAPPYLSNTRAIEKG